ncbi:hypothetical protein BHE74_00036491 [Ensete ventricosum]|nr:hypothetical protein BHE74_00036491 [Ensete ventricosum]
MKGESTGGSPCLGDHSKPGDENGAARGLEGDGEGGKRPRGSDPGGDSLPPAAQEEVPSRGVRQEERPVQERVLPPARSRGPLRPRSQEGTMLLNSAPALTKKKPPAAVCYKSKSRAPAKNGRTHPRDLNSISNDATEEVLCLN